MDKFEEMLNEVVQSNAVRQKNEPCSSEPCSNSREYQIIVTYAEGKEEEARVVQGKSETGAYTLLFAVGKLLGELAGVDGDKVSCELVGEAIKIVAKHAMNDIISDLKELL